jgi:hypothetical protein
VLGWQQRGNLHHVSVVQFEYFVEAVECVVNLVEYTITNLLLGGGGV